MDDRSGTLLQCMANQRTNTDSKKPTQGHRWTTIGLLRGTFEFWLDNCSRERMRMDLSSATKCCQRHQYLASKLLYETSGKMIAFDIESSLREQKSSLRGELNKNRKKESTLTCCTENDVHRCRSLRYSYNKGIFWKRKKLEILKNSPRWFFNKWDGAQQAKSRLATGITQNTTVQGLTTNVHLVWNNRLDKRTTKWTWHMSIIPELYETRKEKLDFIARKGLRRVN